MKDINSITNNLTIMKCKFCESEDTKKQGISIKAGPEGKAVKIQKYQCKVCGRIFLGDEVK